MLTTPRRLRAPYTLAGVMFTLLLAAQAQAQPPATPRADPLDAQARVPALRYESAFARFRRSGDDKPVAWREANEAVARIGGWRAYSREAQQADTTTAGPASSPSPSPSPTPATVPADKSLPARPAGHHH